MNEPRNPENEPTDAAEAKVDSEGGSTPDPEPAADSEAASPSSDLENDPAPDLAPEPTSAAVPRSRQAIFIAAALVVALVLGGGLALAFRGSDDDSGKGSEEAQAEAAAVALLEGTYKSARGDASGCRAMTDNVILQPEQSDFYDRCVEQTNQAGGINENLVINEVKATEVTLDLAAGTGTVKVDVTATVNGETETKNAPVPVKKVDGVWKVNPLG